MVDLNKYSKKDKSKIFHSSGHAQLGFGDRIGSGVNTTFNQRLKAVKKEKRIVDAYQASQIGSLRSVAPKPKRHAKPDVASEVTKKRDSTPTKPKPTASKPGPGIKFKEPPARKYNLFD